VDKPITAKIKVCLLGDGAVGKTSLIRRFVDDIFNDDYLLTIGTKATKKKLIIKKTNPKREYHLTLMIWDIMGQNSFRKILHPIYLKGAKGAMLVCDLTRRETLDHLIDWIDSLNVEGRSIPSVFVANKSDLTDQHVFELAELEKVASANDSPFYTTSAKTGENVERAFSALGKNLIEDIIINKSLGSPAERPKSSESAIASNYNY